MTGAFLKPIPSRLTTWKRWKALFPKTLVLSTETGYSRDYERDPYSGYRRSPFAFFRREEPPPYLPEKELVLDIELGGDARAYPFSLLRKAASPIDDTMGGQKIRVYFDKDSEEAHATLSDGGPVPSLVSYWFVWYSFHPKTEVFRRPAR
jgi:hypothetical protein